VGVGRAELRAEEYVVGIWRENFVGHGVSNMFGNTNNASFELRRVGWETGFLGFVVYLFVELETEENTDIRGDASKSLNGCSPSKLLGC
jgi:hypothetical protein